mmetsp:Transcript_5654/g.13051  ORF Transcript_5654/g.13051 Transcript_5654/m.13051 type:complete len:272 (-) Transcript_5654:141-956(-)
MASRPRPRSPCWSRTLRTRLLPMPSDRRSGITYTDASSQSRGAGALFLLLLRCFCSSFSRARARRSRRFREASKASLYSFVQGRVDRHPPEKSAKGSSSKSSQASSSAWYSREAAADDADPGRASQTSGSTPEGPRGRICAHPRRSPVAESSATTKFRWDIPSGFMSSFATQKAMTGSSSGLPHRNRTLQPLPLFPSLLSLLLLLLAPSGCALRDVDEQRGDNEAGGGGCVFFVGPRRNPVDAPTDRRRRIAPTRASQTIVAASISVRGLL